MVQLLDRGGCCIDTAAQIESYLIEHRYEGFLTVDDENEGCALSDKKYLSLLVLPDRERAHYLHLCVKELGWVQLSTGNLCRKHIAEETEIGKQIDFAIKIW